VWRLELEDEDPVSGIQAKDRVVDCGFVVGCESGEYTERQQCQLRAGVEF